MFQGTRSEPAAALQHNNAGEFFRHWQATHQSGVLSYWLTYSPFLHKFWSIQHSIQVLATILSKSESGIWFWSVSVKQAIRDLKCICVVDLLTCHSHHVCVTNIPSIHITQWTTQNDGSPAHAMYLTGTPNGRGTLQPPTHKSSKPCWLCVSTYFSANNTPLKPAAHVCLLHDLCGRTWHAFIRLVHADVKYVKLCQVYEFCGRCYILMLLDQVAVSVTIALNSMILSVRFIPCELGQTCTELSSNWPNSMEFSLQTVVRAARTKWKRYGLDTLQGIDSWINRQ